MSERLKKKEAWKLHRGKKKKKKREKKTWSEKIKLIIAS